MRRVVPERRDGVFIRLIPISLSNPTKTNTVSPSARSVLVDEVSPETNPNAIVPDRRRFPGSKPIGINEAPSKAEDRQRSQRVGGVGQDGRRGGECHRSRKAHKHLKEPVPAKALYNAEASQRKADATKRAATTAGAAGMLTRPPKGSLSTDARPHQYARLQARLATRELFDVPHERPVSRQPLDEAAKLAKEPLTS